MIVVRAFSVVYNGSYLFSNSLKHNGDMILNEHVVSFIII